MGIDGAGPSREETEFQAGGASTEGDLSSTVGGAEATTPESTERRPDINSMARYLQERGGFCSQYNFQFHFRTNKEGMITGWIRHDRDIIDLRSGVDESSVADLLNKFVSAFTYMGDGRRGDSLGKLGDTRDQIDKALEDFVQQNQLPVRNR